MGHATCSGQLERGGTGQRRSFVWLGTEYLIVLFALSLHPQLITPESSSKEGTQISLDLTISMPTMSR